MSSGGASQPPSAGTRRFWPIVALALGALAGLCGLFLVGSYVFSAVIDRIGEPDQSLLFWYLPLLFIGFAALALGFGVGAWGVYRLRSKKYP